MNTKAKINGHDNGVQTIKSSMEQKTDKKYDNIWSKLKTVIESGEPARLVVVCERRNAVSKMKKSEGHGIADGWEGEVQEGSDMSESRHFCRQVEGTDSQCGRSG